MLRVQLRKALQADPGLAREIADLVRDAAPPGDRYTVVVKDGQGVQVGSHNTQTNTFGPPSA